MQNLNIRPTRGAGKTIARFDAEIADGVRAYDLKLVRGSTGARVYGPSLHGGAAITFTPAIADELATIAWEPVAHYEDR